jgi:single-strand selective monofunctional uracil DNA glycosylase
VGRARAALGGLDVEIGRILHPSPASPAANRGWAEQADRELAALAIDLRR